MVRRVIVPDTSVIVAAFFKELRSKEAEAVLDAIQRQKVSAFAPHAVVVEFLKTAQAKCSTRHTKDLVPRDLVEKQVEAFFDFQASITFIRETHLQVEAWRLMHEESISPPDSWMLACAIHVQGELWVSHDHVDGFVAMAKRHHDQVFTLSSDKRLLP